jgi:hypothetical protein
MIEASPSERKQLLLETDYLKVQGHCATAVFLKRKRNPGLWADARVL